MLWKVLVRVYNLRSYSISFKYAAFWEKSLTWSLILLFNLWKYSKQKRWKQISTTEVYPFLPWTSGPEEIVKYKQGRENKSDLFNKYLIENSGSYQLYQKTESELKEDVTPHLRAAARSIEGEWKRKWCRVFSLIIRWKFLIENFSENFTRYTTNGI